MELIDRFTNIYQHGGYVQDKSRLPVVLLFGKYLPLKTEENYEEILKELFVYVISMLDNLIFDQYIFIYFHSGVGQNQLPSLPWIRQFYEIINDRMKKCLNSLYIVHPSPWIRTTLKLSKPFISKKFWHKLQLISSTADLYNTIQLEPHNIPLEILQMEAKINLKSSKKKCSRRMD